MPKHSNCNKSKKCCKPDKKLYCDHHMLSSRNPYDVGIVQNKGDGNYMLLLSGNHKGNHDMDADNLPDWVALSKISDRKYHSVGTQEVVDAVKKTDSPNPKPKPNVLLNYTTVNEKSGSGTFELKDINLHHDEYGQLLALDLKALNSKDEHSLKNFDSSNNRISDVHLVLDSLKLKKEDSATRSNVSSCCESNRPSYCGCNISKPSYCCKYESNSSNCKTAKNGAKIPKSFLESISKD